MSPLRAGAFRGASRTCSELFPLSPGGADSSCAELLPCLPDRTEGAKEERRWRSLAGTFLRLGVPQVACKPGSIKTSKKFEAEIYVLTKEEGGRHTAFFTNYRPQFYLRTADVTGKVTLPDEVKMVMPGDNVTATFELISPVAIDAGTVHTPVQYPWPVDRGTVLL